MLNFGNGDTEFPLPSSAAHAWSAQSDKKKKERYKERKQKLKERPTDQCQSLLD